MLELVRGYATAALDTVERSGDRGIAGLSGDLTAVAGLLVSSEELRGALTDGAIPSAARSAVLEDLLAGKVADESLRVLTYVIAWERATELPKTVEELVEVVEFARQGAEAGGRELAEPSIGRTAALERVRGYADFEFESVREPAEVDEIEDELFRLSRLVDSSKSLKEALVNGELPLSARVALLSDLVAGKVHDATGRLACYLLRAGRIRDVVGGLAYLAELAARERGRRVAHVKAAVELSEDETDRLSAALGRIVRRPVELRVTIDPAVIGGVEVEVGDTVIDGTLRHRLEQLRETLLQRA
jgi:F-type H+-transporting ATPase subunit delta